MGKVRAKIERKHPRYRISGKRDIWAGNSRIISHASMTAAEAEYLVSQHNELLDKLVEAAEFLNEVVPGGVA